MFRLQGIQIEGKNIMTATHDVKLKSRFHVSHYRDVFLKWSFEVLSWSQFLRHFSFEQPSAPSYTRVCSNSSQRRELSERVCDSRPESAPTVLLPLDDTSHSRVCFQLNEPRCSKQIPRLLVPASLHPHGCSRASLSSWGCFASGTPDRGGFSFP